MSVLKAPSRTDWASAKRFRISIVALVLALTAAALAWPLISSSGLSLVRTQRLAINDLKRLRSGDPVELTGTVSFVDTEAKAFYFQDAASGIRIELDGATLPEPGERIVVRGRIRREYDASVGLRGVTFADLEIVERGEADLPEPQVLAIPDLLRGTQQIEGRRVQTGGVVRMVHLDRDRLTLELGDAGQRMLVTVLRAGEVDANALIDARVTVRGALQLGLDRMAETFAPHLWVSAPEDLHVTHAAPETQLVASAHALYVESKWLNAGHRVALDGTIVRVESEGTVLVDSGGLLLPVEGEGFEAYRTGERVRVTGWPTRQRWNVVLERSKVSREPSVDHAQDSELDASLTKIEQIRALRRDAAAKHLPLQIKGVVTFVHYAHQFAFVQSGESGIWVDAWGQSLEDLRPGHLVEIIGVSAPGEFAPVIAQPWFKVSGDAPMPHAQSIDAEIAPSGAYDSEWVELEGLMRPFSPDGVYTEFAIDTEIGSVAGLLVEKAEASVLDRYIDARVRVRGVLATSFTRKGVLTGYRIFVHSLDDMQIVEAAPDTTHLETPTPIDELLRFRADAEHSRRVLVRGVVTYRVPGQIYIEDPTGSLKIQASDSAARVGDVVEAIGYASPSSKGPILTDATVRRLGLRGEIKPLEIVPEQILSGNYDNRLVTVEARLVSRGESAAQQTLVLQSGYTVFNAELEGSVPLGALRDGSIVRVVGICAVERRMLNDRFRGDFNAVPESFRLLLRSADDVTLVRAAPWWNWRHAWPVIGLFMFSIAAAMVWGRTLRRRVEAQTSEIEKRSGFLRQIIDMCPDFISVRDAAGRYTLANRALAGQYGRMPDDLIGKTERELGVFAPEASAIESSDREVLQSRAEKTIAEHPRVARSGELLWLKTVKRPILDTEGEATHVLEVSNDITAHKHAEEILDSARSAAEGANRAKSEFLANMSHEIRTPLNGIIGMSELCLDTDLTSEQREYVQALKLSGDGLLGVVNDILDFSKIEAGKLQLEARPFDLYEAIESVAKALALQAHRQGIDLMYEIAPNLPRMLIGDSNRLRQVLLNMIGDAIKETERGEVVLSAMLFGQDEARSTVQFTILETSDRGESELPNDRFQPGAECGSSSTNNLSGGELGVTISARLIGLMDGRVWSEVDTEGRRLNFTVVLGSSAQQPKPPPQLGGLLLRGARVLIVDDNVTQRRILDRALARAGMRPVLAGSASEGVERLQECINSGDPCVVCMVDYEMPINDGGSFVNLLHERRLEIRVVMMVRTIGQRESAARCRALNVDAVLVKPFSEEDARAALGRVLEERESRNTESSSQSHDTALPRVGLDVLVAEDNTVNQMVMQRLLHKRGHRVVIAGSGKAALQALERQRFDLILMDVQMPELDGLEATREIRRREDGRERTPIVALTAHAMSGDRERCLAAGMDGYMTKPINPAELDEMLQKYAAR